MKIRDIIGEDAYDKTLEKLKAPKKKAPSELGKEVSKGVERGNRIYDKVKALATRKIPFA